MSSRTYHLFEEVVAVSFADNWADARLEWDVSSFTTMDDETCVCGKKHIVRCYTIRNCVNGNMLFPIGSECVHKFERSDMDNQARYLALVERRRVAAEVAEALRVIEAAKETERRLLEEELIDATFVVDYESEWEQFYERELERLRREELAEEARVRNEAARREADRREYRRLSGRTLTTGKYAGRTFEYVSTVLPFYVEFVRANSRRDELQDLVRYFDGRNNR
jgi:hypothetical protein